LVPVLVVTKVAYLLATLVGPETEVRFLGDLAAGDLVPEQVAPADWLRIAELVAIYRDLPLGTVDASVMAVAERLGSTTIATLDRWHFSVVRPAHFPVFDLVPQDDPTLDHGRRSPVAGAADRDTSVGNSG
jgi:uncharacterized protein